MNELTVVIQAGGESKRMGSPKALVSFCGAPLICRAIKRLTSIADELLVTTNDQESLEFLCDDAAHVNPKLYSDLFESRSALNGLHTALYYATNPFVAVVACDMIFPSAPILIAERDALIKTGAAIAVPKVSRGYEPFHAVYRRDVCLPLVRAALDRGETRATIWYEQAEIIAFDREEMLDIDPRGGTLVNVNTPKELAEIQQRINDGTLSKANVSQDPSFDHSLIGDSKPAHL